MISRSSLLLGFPLVLFAGACGADPAASSATERTAEATAALTAGAGSVGSCNGNPARCATVSLTAGLYHTVVLKADGTVWAFGHNGEGELGDTTKIDHTTPIQVSGNRGADCCHCQSRLLSGR